MPQNAITFECLRFLHRKAYHRYRYDTDRGRNMDDLLKCPVYFRGAKRCSGMARVRGPC